MKKTGILLIQLGSPKTTSVADVSEYLHEFLTDPRLIPHAKSLWWKLLLKWVILPKRSPQSAEKYASIVVEGELPLVKYTQEFFAKVQKYTHEPIQYAYALGQGPTCLEAIKKLMDQGCDHIRIIPLFPQFAVATTLSAKDQVLKALKQIPSPPTYELTPSFHDSQTFIAAQVRQIQPILDQHSVEKLVISFHSYPLARIQDGDPYEQHCIATAQGIVARLQNFDPQNVVICYQSKLGRSKWLEPATSQVIEDLATAGVKSIAVCAPAFVVDNLETLEEMGIEAREEFLKHGGQNFYLIPCPNAEETWCQDFAKDLTQNHRQIPKIEVQEVPKLQIPVQEKAATKLTVQSKKAFQLMAFILFLDSAGFSMIFPLFPSLLKQYLGNESEVGFFQHVLLGVNNFELWMGISSPFATIVLFGGLLSFVYGFLQFLSAPIMGKLSDRVGRKPILLFSMLGLAASYFLWGIAGSFTVLVISRLLAGLMGSSITSASAVVADLTDSTNRGKGMAILGASFGMGFVFGPALGGFAASIRLDEILPVFAAQGSAIGLHPFSTPAFLAFLLSMSAAHFLFYYFKETHDPRKHQDVIQPFSLNPFKVLATKQYPGVALTNTIQFFYLFAFAAAEFSMTFLTTERLNYSAKENGLLFLYMGFLLIFVQGGYVRRKAHEVGELKLVKQGILLLIPSMLFVAFAPNTWVLLLGLGMMSLGASLLNPSLNALVSRYTPAHEQGRIQGIYRSLGSLGRCIGPLVSCVIFWRYGSAYAYLFVAIALLIPGWLILKLPKPQAHE